MKNELEHIFSTYFSEETAIHCYGDEEHISKLVPLLQALVPFEHPDAYSKVENKVLIFEHFEFDSSNNSRNGTQQRKSIAADDRAFDAVVPTEAGAVYHGQIIADYSIENYRNNLKRSFDKHYKEIPEYKNTLRETGVITDTDEVITLFFIEDRTELGTIFESKREGVSWEPLILPHCDFFLDLFEKSQDLDMAICASWYPKQYCLWFIDRTMIAESRGHMVSTSDIKIINTNPRCLGYKIIIPKDALSEKINDV